MKTEITDEMVERARKEFYEYVGQMYGGARLQMEPWFARRVLEAALNAPATPEIVVTEEMKQAGLGALNSPPEDGES